MTDKLLPCPFCGCEMNLRSNRDWHRIVGTHDDLCVFMDSETLMVPASDEQKALAIADWNRRANSATPTDGEAVEVVAWLDDHWLKSATTSPVVVSDWKANGGVPQPLMTVAQHERLMAAEIQKRFDGNEQSSREHQEELDRLNANPTVKDCLTVPFEPTDKMLDVAVSFALNVKISSAYGWSDYMRDVWQRMYQAAQADK